MMSRGKLGPGVTKAAHAARRWAYAGVSITGLALCAGLVFRFAPSAFAQIFLEANVKVDFRQAANDDSPDPPYGLGNVHWINSIVQESNARYYEGTSNPQRVVFDDIPATAGNLHSLGFNHQATKGGIHAYDFVTSWEQAVLAGDAVLPPPPGILTGDNLPVLPFYADDGCDDDLGPPASLTATCTTLRAGANCVVVSVPDDPFISKDGSTQDRIDAYEGSFGNRTVRICGNTPISTASLAMCGHDVANLGDTGDSNISYMLSWTSTSTQLVVEMAGHLSVTGDPNVMPIAWGLGLGSGQIAGGPYHFRLDNLGGTAPGCVQTDVTSIGSEDNQIKGADVNCLCPTDCDDLVACTIDDCDQNTCTCDNCPCTHTPDHSACNDNNDCTDDTCDALQDCVFTPDNSNSCKDGFYCNGNEQCVGGVCQPGSDPCNDGVSCTKDSCNESNDTCGNLANSANCPDDGNPCSDQVCHPTLGCQIVCDDTNLCEDGLHCNGMSSCLNCQCVDGPAPCPPDPFACTNDFCDEVDNVCVCVPDNSVCDNLLFCDGVEQCVCGLGCVDGPDPCTPPLVCKETSPPGTGICNGCTNDAMCQDGLFCNGFETCDLNTAKCVDGPDPCGPDGLDCTIDICVEGPNLTDNLGKCEYIPDPQFCFDGNDCTDDICNPAATPPGTGCEYACNTSGCADGNLCTLNDVCSGTIPPCTCSGTPRDCSHLNDTCVMGVCDPSTGNCITVPTNEGGPCDDGLFCTCGDRCVGGVCTPVNSGGVCCSDGIDCTNDLCDEALDVCTNVGKDSNCDDGAFCNGAEICDVPARDCVDGPDPCPEDMFACTTISCDETSNGCVCTADDGRCDDFDICTTDDCVCGVGCVYAPSGLCGACCDGTTGDCADDVICADCVALGGQHECFPGETCTEIITMGLCVRHRGACCDGNTGLCADDVFDDNCVGDQFTWFKDETCAVVEARGDCEQHRGACCNAALPGGVCTDNVLPGDCVNVDADDQLSWFKGETCAYVEQYGLCEEHRGACCDAAAVGGACTDNVLIGDCRNVDPDDQFTWSKNETCAEVEARLGCEEHLGACCDRRISDPVDRCTYIPARLCIIDDPSQVSYHKGMTCAEIDPGCEEHRGACCDHSPGAGGPEPEGACTNDVLPSDCAGPQQTWHKDELCADVVCLETLGACCNKLDGTCSPGRVQSECLAENPAQREWTKGATCADVVCEAVFGACCDEDTFGGCTQTTQSGCNCKKCVWHKLMDCNQIDCNHNSIPTMSQWGVVVLTLLLLTGAKVYFGRRTPQSA